MEYTGGRELITVQSAHSATVTIQCLQETIVAKGWTILATIDQLAYAAQFCVKIPARTTISFANMSG